MPDISSSLLLYAGSVGAALFVVTFLIDGATRQGYRPTYHAVSALALGGRGWVQVANFVVCGSLIVAASVGIQQVGSTWLAALVALWGVSLVLSGVFSMDPVRGYPAGTPKGDPDNFSTAHQVHDWAGMAVFMSLPAAAIAAALTLDEQLWIIASVAAALVCGALAVAFGSAWERDHPRVGLIQRAMIIVGWAWLGAVCWHLAG